MKKIAIVGTGIAGMGAGYLLRNDYDITFFEKNDYPGGHTNTLTIDEEGTPVHIDSAFMVYNDITYPNLIRLFDELNIESFDTDMSFSVQHIPSGLDYSGTGINGLFSQRKNVFNPRFIKMLMDIDRFNKQGPKILDNEKYLTYTLAQYVKEEGFGEDFVYKFLIPMSSAVWSTPIDLMLEFPAQTLIRFFKNHGFLGLTTHYQWKTVKGGSRQYRDKLLSHFEGRVHINNGIEEVRRIENGVELFDVRGMRHVFDKVILASHADHTLSILKDATEEERNLLSCFKYQKNKATLHTDTRLMPRTKRAWSSWNYRIDEDKQGKLVPTTIYHMNSLQNVSQKKDYFVSINDPDIVKDEHVLWERYYDHPLFTVEAIRAQEKLPELNDNGQVYFCGSYFKYGFHEDAFTSGLNVAEKITGRRIYP